MTPAPTLTANERRALAEFAKPKVDWSKVHGNTRDSLQRKKLLQGHTLTDAGRAELAVPNIFDDLFDNKKTSMPKAKKTTSKKSKPYKAVDEFRPIEHADTFLHDPIRERWEAGADKSGVRLYCTSSPLTHGEENGRWALQIFARVKIKRGRPGRHVASNTASMAREDLLWLRKMIDDALGER